MEGIQTVPGGGKDPWTEGAVSLGVINITDLCNLTHFRSPSATTTTRSIFLPFLLLKPVHPPPPPSLFRSSLFASFLDLQASEECTVFVSFFFPLSPSSPSDKDPPPQRVVDARISLHLSIYGKEDFYNNTVGTKRDAVFNFQSAKLVFLRRLRGATL